MTTTSTHLNEVDIGAVGSLIETIRQNPAKADTKWAASVTWEGGFRSQGRVRKFPPSPSDEPTGLGGTDSAPNPVEQLLSALGNCLAVGYAANLTAAGIAINDLRIDLEGDLDLHTFLGLADGNAGYEQIRVAVHLDAEADEATLAEIHSKVVATSPVGHTLTRPIPVEIDLA